MYSLVISFKITDSLKIHFGLPWLNYHRLFLRVFFLPQFWWRLSDSLKLYDVRWSSGVQVDVLSSFLFALSLEAVSQSLSLPWTWRAARWSGPPKTSPARSMSSRWGVVWGVVCHPDLCLSKATQVLTSVFLLLAAEDPSGHRAAHSIG